MTTVPGFSSRVTSTTVRQLPQRDEALMNYPEPGFSNSKPSEPVKDDDTEAEAKVVESAVVEDKAVKPARTRKK